MKALLNSADLRSLDKYTVKEQGISSFQLMERAARAFCKLYIQLFESRNQMICIVTGPGNNGGDGFAIARLLYQQGYSSICVYEDEHYRENSNVNDRSKNKDLLKRISGIRWIRTSAALQYILETNTANTIDAIFGTGLNRDVSFEWQSIISIINKYSSTVISVDMPSGLQSDQEKIESKQQHIVKAQHTFTFQTLKRSMTFPETGEYCGRIHVLDIGLSENFESTSFDQIYLIDQSIWLTIEAGQTFDHKSSNGKTLHFCGSKSMPGAAILCSRAAHRSGAGYVIAVVPVENRNLMINQHPEVLPITYDEPDGLSFAQILSQNKGIHSILAGPGLGTSDFTEKRIDELLELRLDIPLILDADALNVLSGNAEKLSTWPGPLVITPHAKEFDRLFGLSENWAERELKMRQLSASLNICIVLKGAFSRIAFPDGTLYINTSGNPGLAKAGSGDVLSGMLSAHLARYKGFKNAVLSAVFLHGKIADDLTCIWSERSILASDLIEQLGKSIKLLETNE